MSHNRHSHAMDGLKLLFMLMIVLHHSSFFSKILRHAYMAVDLFFMISGYLLMLTSNSRPQLGTGQYFFSRLVRLYPHYLFSFAAMFFSVSLFRAGTITPAMLIQSLPEIFLVQNLGIFDGGLNYPCWYLSVLIYAGVLVFFLRRKLSHHWFNGLAIPCICISYGYTLYFTGGSMESFSTVGVFYLPFWRGMAGLFCGTLLYQLHVLMRPVFRKYSRIFCIVEVVSLLCSIVLMFAPGQVDGLILVCLFILLLTAGNEHSVIEQLSNCAVVKLAIRYEYAVFLNHALIIVSLRKFILNQLEISTYIKLAVLLTVLVIYSVVTELFVSCSVNFLTSHQKKTKV